MKLLVHMCCGPCAAYPVAVLKKEGIALQGFFFNPNIHPFREFRRRLQAMKELAEKEKIDVAFENRYGLQDYLRAVVFQEEKRCEVCYAMRLEATAVKAKESGADAFTSTLLYSRYQKHELIRKTAENMAEKYNIPFYYRDFREGWQTGIDMAVDQGLYRQAYCGCIYSEQERYDKNFRKQARQTAQTNKA